MQEHDGRPAAETASQNGAVVTAHEVTRRYGEGDTASTPCAACRSRWRRRS